MASPRSDHEQFLALLEDHHRALRKICWAYCYTSHDRDDLLQEILVRLWASFGRYDRSRRFSTWMYRVALNVAIDFQRRQRRRGREKTTLDDQETAIPSTLADNALKREQLRDLRDLLERQNDTDRAVLLLYLDGNSYRDIGEVMGMSESSVGTRLNRLKTSMKQSVEDSSKTESGE
jgi:RNA polymerase sigma-70 factor, ECF subfamily